MQIIDWSKAKKDERAQALARPPQATDSALANRVDEIIAAVRARGDAALFDFARAFDKAELTSLRVPVAAARAALDALPAPLRAALEQAKANIELFHRAELPRAQTVETMPGVRCELQWRAMDAVGLYVPGGTAPLFSSVLMQAIPAKIAGCGRVVLCSPPGRDGTINAGILAAAALCGVDEIYAVGGAQAIAAMAFGTQSIAKVDKIFGPGNAYVTAAKQQVSQAADGAAIDMPAGPSEVMVMADPPARAEWVAADLLAQAEHGADSQAILVTTDAAFAAAVRDEVERQLALLPRRDLAAQAIAQSRVLVVGDRAAAIDAANLYAPEHLIIHGDDATACVPRIRNAGSVFVGDWSPESAGDYASGTNHVLPTYGYARAYSGLNILSFMKSMTVQSLSREGLRALAPAIVAMAQAEGLDAHARAVTIRMES